MRAYGDARSVVLSHLLYFVTAVTRL